MQRVRRHTLCYTLSRQRVSGEERLFEVLDRMFAAGATTALVVQEPGLTESAGDVDGVITREEIGKAMEGAVELYGDR